MFARRPSPENGTHFVVHVQGREVLNVPLTVDPNVCFSPVVCGVADRNSGALGIIAKWMLS